MVKFGPKLLGGSAFALFERFDIVNDGKLYLRRWRLIETPWFGVLVHRIYLPDPDRHLHDHPWSFWSWILRGDYHEEIGGTWKYRRWLQLFYRSAERAHRIVSVAPNTWTLVLRGRRRRVWGFHTEDGWVDWKTYVDERDAEAEACG